MSKMDRIAEKHPALSLSDLKFAGEYLEEICACDYPKETALLARGKSTLATLEQNFKQEKVYI